MIYTVSPCFVTVAEVFSLGKGAVVSEKRSSGENEAFLIYTLCTYIKIYFVTMLWICGFLTLHFHVVCWTSTTF